MSFLNPLKIKLEKCRTDSEIQKIWKMSEEICIEFGLSKAEDADYKKGVLNTQFKFQISCRILIVEAFIKEK